MLPIRDHNPSLRAPLVTWVLIALNVAIHLQVMAAHPGEAALYRFYMDWALVPRLVTTGQNVDGLLTSMFLHADLWHLAGNMLFLWIFGDNLEDALGRAGFLLFYLAGGAAAGVAQWAVAPWSAAPTIGASGAVAAVMGGYLLLYPRARVDVLIFLVFIIRILPFPAWTILWVWFAFQVVGALASDAASGGIAYWAHVGGFLAGIALMVPAWFLRGGPALWARSGGRPSHAPARWGAIRSTSFPEIRRTLTRRAGPPRRGPWGG
ncbi:MAG: rhomboid family intramembrane serine protease [Rubellimicrobium sp.]|nr:rhomboid family intramembrane serine protease [Rubellimicrobium sp.]